MIFFSFEDLSFFKDYVLNKKNGVIQDSYIIEKIWNNYKNKLVTIQENLTGLLNWVTITNSGGFTLLHRDLKLEDEKFKILIYLNQIEDGGTIFIIDDVEYLIENKSNRLVLFDIELYHKGQIFAEKNKNKLCLGFRVK